MPGLVPFRPNPTQERFVYSSERFCGLYGGVGNGKSAAGCIRMLMLCDLFPRQNALVGRLTYPELRDTTMKDLLDVVRERNGGTLDEGPYVKSWQKEEKVLTLQNESLISFRYLENYESILSMNLGAFWIDQAEFVPERTYLALESRLRYWGPDERDPEHPDEPTFKEKWAEWYTKKYGKPPAVMPTEFGFITGNPGPGWVFDRYKRNTTGLYTLFEAPTAENKRNLPRGYEEHLRKSYSEDYVRRFLDGDWSVNAGSVYKEYDSRLHVVDPKETTFWDAKEERFSVPSYFPIFLGADHGQRNPTAMEGFAVDEDGNAIFFLEHYKTSSVIAEHAQGMKQVCEGHAVRRGDNGELFMWMDPNVSGTSDPNTGRDFRQLYYDHGIIGAVANKNVNAGIGRIEYLLKPDSTRKFPKWHPRRGEFGSPRLFIIKGMCPALETEFPLYRWEENKSGRDANERERPLKYMDHAMDASRYAIMAWFDQTAEEPQHEAVDTYSKFVHAQMIGRDKEGGPW